MATPYNLLEAELTQTLAALDAAETAQTPPGVPHKWSIHQVIEHLLLSYASTHAIIALRLDKGTPTKAKPSLQQRLAQFVIITLGKFPAGRAAPPAVMPSAVETPANGKELASQVQSALARLRAQSAQAERLFGHRRFASHLVLGPLAAHQWQRFHLVHGRHHLRQIQAVLQSSSRQANPRPPSRP